MFQLAKELFFLDLSKKKKGFSPPHPLFCPCFREISLKITFVWEDFVNFVFAMRLRWRSL